MPCWGVDPVAAGAFPQHRHDTTTFNPDEPHRRTAASKQLRHKFACLYFKGDWMEYITTMGLASWKTTLAPCPWCKATTRPESLFCTDGYKPNSFPHDRRDHLDYERACRHCEILVTVADDETHYNIKGALFYGRRKSGARGRALRHEIPSLSFCNGDRLAPFSGLRDIAGFEQCRPPFVCLFWRRSLETSVRRRNPLFSLAIGLTINSLCVDILHTVHLGVLARYISFCWWQLCLSNSFGLVGPTENELVSRSVDVIRLELFRWYKTYRRQSHDHALLTELEDLQVKHLGDKGNLTLKVKGAATRPLLPFTLWLLRNLPMPRRLSQQDDLLRAGDGLEKLLLLLRREGDVLSAEALQDQCDKKQKSFLILRSDL